MARILRPDEAFERHAGWTALERAEAAAVREHVAAIDKLEKSARGRTILRVIRAAERGRSPEAIAKAAGVSKATYYRVVADARYRAYMAMWRRYETLCAKLEKLPRRHDPTYKPGEVYDNYRPQRVRRACPAD